jgi:streptogramin lyase
MSRRRGKRSRGRLGGIPLSFGKSTPDGTVTEFTTPGCYPEASIQAYGIATGPDGNLWITVNGAGFIARVTP